MTKDEIRAHIKQILAMRDTASKREKAAINARITELARRLL